MNAFRTNGSTIGRDVIVRRKAKKVKTPEGCYKLDGKIYQMREAAEVKSKVFCQKCQKENADVIGSFRDDFGTINYVIKCPKHSDDIYHLSETRFRVKFPGILPQTSSESLFGADGLPVVRSYCRECRGTTGQVVGETPTHWNVQCACGQNWNENKLSFEQKYMGKDGQQPDYPQREPGERNWNDSSSDGFEIRQMQDLLKDFNAKKKEKSSMKNDNNITPSEKKEEVAEVAEKTEVKNLVNSAAEVTAEQAEEKTLVTFVVSGVKISFCEGTTITVDKEVDGQVHGIVH